MREGHYEVVLEDRHLLGVFFAVVLLCAVFFTLGFVLGRSQSKSVRSATPPAEAKQTQAEATPPGTAAQDLSFYDRVEEKRAPAEKLPARSEPAPPARTSPPSPPPAAPSRTAAKPEPTLYLQVAAFGQEPEAKRLVEELLQMGFPARLLPPREDHFYRVQVGPFSSEELALAAQRRLETQGFRPILRR